MSRKILGISAFYHDSAAALVVNGEIIAAAQEERFTRQKHTAVFPSQAVAYCLKEGGLTLDELDAVVFYDKPFLKFERLLETYYAFAPRGLVSFITSMPAWLGGKLLLKQQIKKELKEIMPFDRKKLKLLFTEHHLAHAASAFYPSPFASAALLTIDGAGEWCTASMGIANGNGITFLREMNFPHSVGLLYSAFTYYLGFTVNSGEYKLMGLAPYGNSGSEQVKDYVSKIKAQLVTINADGSIWLNQAYFNYAAGLRMTRDRKWQQLFGIARRGEELPVTQQHCDLALAIQLVTEEIVLGMAAELKRITGAEHLCMAGGVALNCVANAKLRDSGLFRSVFVQPAAGDAGGALGAALAAHHIYFKGERQLTPSRDGMKGAYLGPAFSRGAIDDVCLVHGAVYKSYGQFDALCDDVSGLLAGGAVVGWFQGRMEFGPRALGNRSILADARNKDMQKKLNLKIKYREGFRPFAPSVLASQASAYFRVTGESPYMLFVAEINDNGRKAVPPGFSALSPMDKLYSDRGTLPAITHVDFSARLQTVHEDTNPEFSSLLKAFYKLTGVPLLVNTSFNVRGEPLVCTPEDAYRCFMNTEMDYLVLNSCLFVKTDQPHWQDREKWKREFKKD